MKVTVLIAEDDPDMRQVIKKVVEEVEGVEVVGEAGDGIEAIKLIEEFAPQVVFVDIDLPGKNGVELAHEIFDINPWTFIVFATAFSEYRDEAFDVYAFDYLVKPFKLNRLRQTMERINLVLSEKVMSKPISQLDNRQYKTNRKQFFKIGKKIVYLNLDDIIYITREERKSIIYYKGGKVEINEHLTGLEEQLGGPPFFRSHSGFIVNLRMIKELIPIGRSSYQLIMENTDKRPLMTVERFKQLEVLQM